MATSPLQHRQLLIESLADQPEIAGTLELVWRQARASLPPALLADWVAACRDIAERIGSNAALGYIRNAPRVAAAAGPEAALALASSALLIAGRVGGHAASALFVAAPQAARRLASVAAFAEWLRLAQHIAELAPESIGPFLECSGRLLDRLDFRSFETWALGGIRAAENQPERRLKFFALQDTTALRALEHRDEAVSFTDVERRLKAFVVALWCRLPPIRVQPPGAFDMPRRTSFGNRLIHVPPAFRGLGAGGGRDLYFAALAHVMAHFAFTPAKVTVGGLKPVQIALVSLVEDARVEQLAIMRFPGLRRFWLRFHIADPAGAVTAPALMARLSRALLDPGYADPHAWVNKGRDLFFADPAAWHDSALSRRIGSLLGNDLGQMRVQFNARTYVVEPPYRDDNLGLWDLPATAAATGETLYEAARFEEAEGEPADRERPADADRDGSGLARLEPEEAEVGIPVARYPEWDFLIGRDRNDWTTVVEYAAAEGRAEQVDSIRERYPQTAYRIEALIRAAKVSRPTRLRRQSEGDRLDLEATIAAAIDRQVGITPSPNVYSRLERRSRDLAVLVLLDASQSANDIVKAAGRSVLELERDATALLAQAMHGLGDPFAIHAFCSDTREDVQYYRIKDFDEFWGAAAKRRLAGITGRFSTRIGAALRHAGRELASRRSYRRLLLLISDGEPSDIDIGDRRYLVEDARRAVLSVRALGVDVFCVGLDAGGDTYLSHIFGRQNVVQFDRVERLPEKLPLLYLRLTG